MQVPQQKRRIEATTILWFGRYLGCEARDVPYSYLVWLENTIPNVIIDQDFLERKADEEDSEIQEVERWTC